MTHTAPEDSTGRRLVTDLIEFLIETNSKDTLKAISCDGTATERDLQQRLLPLSCMLHAVELPLQHVFDHCDGNHGTTGPNSFGGPLGQKLKADIHLKSTERVETNSEEVMKLSSCCQMTKDSFTNISEQSMRGKYQQS